MTDIPPPESPGWYADAHGAWWWWDGRGWSPAPGAHPGAAAGGPQQERTQALLMWVLYLVLGGWIVALVFYLISKDKPFVRHHAAEALNLTVLLLIPQILGFALLVPGYIDLITTDPGDDLTVPGTFWVGLGVLLLVSILNYAFGIAAAVKAHRGRWWRMPIGIHPVRGVLRKGEAPPFDVGT